MNKYFMLIQILEFFFCKFFLEYFQHLSLDNKIAYHFHSYHFHFRRTVKSVESTRFIWLQILPCSFALEGKTWGHQLRYPCYWPFFSKMLILKASPKPFISFKPTISLSSLTSFNSLISQVSVVLYYILLVIFTSCLLIWSSRCRRISSVLDRTPCSALSSAISCLFFLYIVLLLLSLFTYLLNWKIVHKKLAYTCNKITDYP